MWKSGGKGFTREKLSFFQTHDGERMAGLIGRQTPRRRVDCKPPETHGPIMQRCPAENHALSICRCLLMLGPIGFLPILPAVLFLDLNRLGLRRAVPPAPSEEHSSAGTRKCQLTAGRNRAARGALTESFVSIVRPGGRSQVGAMTSIDSRIPQAYPSAPGG